MVKTIFRVQFKIQFRLLGPAGKITENGSHSNRNSNVILRYYRFRIPVHIPTEILKGYYAISSFAVSLGHPTRITAEAAVMWRKRNFCDTFYMFAAHDRRHQLLYDETLEVLSMVDNVPLRELAGFNRMSGSSSSHYFTLGHMFTE